MPFCTLTGPYSLWNKSAQFPENRPQKKPCPVAVKYRSVLFKLNWVLWCLWENTGLLRLFIHDWCNSAYVLNSPRSTGEYLSSYTSHCRLTISRAESILIGVICWCYLDSSRGWENQDVCAGGILWGVQLRWLQIQRGAPAEHWAHSDSICQNRSNSRDVHFRHLQNRCSVFKLHFGAPNLGLQANTCLRVLILKQITRGAWNQDHKLYR